MGMSRAHVACSNAPCIEAYGAAYRASCSATALAANPHYFYRADFPVITHLK